MASDGQAFEQRYALYIDFLGTKDAVANWPVTKVHEFVDLLLALVHARGPQNISRERMQDGGYKLNIRPEISTFSDHIVASYPGVRSEDGRVADIMQPLWAEFICRDSIRVMSMIAERGLRLGLLMRGGLSFGELFHGDEVVFGEALVDAYRLECKVAEMPRVVVSERVWEQLQGGPSAHPDLLVRDDDGHWHLNYFLHMRHYEVDSEQTDSVFQWNAEMRQIIGANRDALKDRPSESAKWDWFDIRFRAATDL